MSEDNQSDMGDTGYKPTSKVPTPTPSRRKLRSKIESKSPRCKSHTKPKESAIEVLNRSFEVLDTTHDTTEQTISLLKKSNCQIPVKVSLASETESQGCVTENQGTSKIETENLRKLGVVELQKTKRTADDIVYENYPSTSWSLHQDFLSIMAYNPEHSDSTHGPNKETEALREMLAEKLREMRRNDEILNPQQFESNNQIGLREALNLLPKSYDGMNTENLDMFLEKCEFVLECTVPPAVPSLLHAIQTRLTGKARRVIRFKLFESWEELRDALKSELQPQCTTPNLYLKLYSTKQNPEEDIFTYSSRIEKLQNLIIEQETAKHPIEIATALEQTITRQVLQVFIEGLGELKHFIKARYPETLSKAIQLAKEEERIRNSAKGSKTFLKNVLKPNSSQRQTTITCFNCNKIGHISKYCKTPATFPSHPPNQSQNSQGPTMTASTSQNPYTPKTRATINPATAVNQKIECRYCKKPGHLLADCRKRAWVNAKNNNQKEHQGNDDRRGQVGRPKSEIKTAEIQFSN
jgi:hypothetical protein